MKTQATILFLLITTPASADLIVGTLWTQDVTSDCPGKGAGILRVHYKVHSDWPGTGGVSASTDGSLWGVTGVGHSRRHVEEDGSISLNIRAKHNEYTGLADINVSNGVISVGPYIMEDASRPEQGCTLSGPISGMRPEEAYFAGDVDMDGRFTTGDLVNAFAGGAYEQDRFATWFQGDWTGDARFDSSDMVLAFKEGNFTKNASMVPEPSCLALLPLSIPLLMLSRKRR